MDLSARVLGVHTATALSDRARAPVLKIGSDTFTRGALADVACFNFQAAATLSRVLADYGVKNTRDVFDRVPPSSLAVPHIGAVAIAVLGAAFERHHLGGDHPLEAWIKKHRDPTARREVVTFDTVKSHRKDTEDADRKQRKHARRNTAQRTRVDRFTKRQQSKEIQNGQSR